MSAVHRRRQCRRRAAVSMSIARVTRFAATRLDASAMRSERGMLALRARVNEEHDIHAKA